MAGGDLKGMRDVYRQINIHESEWNNWMIDTFSFQPIGYLQTANGKHKITGEERLIQVFLEPLTFPEFFNEPPGNLV